MEIVIVGAGTAGWITALLARAIVPFHPITVVRSGEIGTVGAGEGTTPHFLSLFADTIGVPVPTLLRETGATLKTAVRFIGWRGDDRAYLHPFDARGQRPLDLGVIHPDHPEDTDDLHLLTYLARRGRVPLRAPNRTGTMSAALLDHLVPLGDVALHVDASRLATFLETLGRARGVEVIEGRVAQATRGPRGEVVSIGLADGRQIPGDLFVDCSGFHRLLIGKLLDAPWVDARGALPVSRGIPFTLPGDADPPPLTDAIAMRAGWCWKIPVEGRYGCGYVFDPEFTSDEQALADISARFPGADPVRTVPFEAGYFERAWEHNVVAIGLSSGFLEPLEATSIWHTILCARELLQVYLPLGDTAARDDFNRFHRTFMERTVAFLHAHYLTGRTDLPFWSTFAERTRRPDLLQDLLHGGRLRWIFDPPPALSGHPSPFLPTSWNQVALGTGLSCLDAHAAYWRYFRLGESYEQRRRARLAEVEAEAAGCVRHGDLLRAIRG
jgi:tryptophan 7-halogenase